MDGSHTPGIVTSTVREWIDEADEGRIADEAAPAQVGGRSVPRVNFAEADPMRSATDADGGREGADDGRATLNDVAVRAIVWMVEALTKDSTAVGQWISPLPPAAHSPGVGCRWPRSFGQQHLMRGSRSGVEVDVGHHHRSRQRGAKLPLRMSGQAVGPASLDVEGELGHAAAAVEDARDGEVPPVTPM